MGPLSLDIDKDSSVPIYFQLKQGIGKLIDADALKPGESLPSENELSRAYSISPMTVRHAMAELVNEGYIHRERGRGTFVSSRRMQHQLETLVSFSEDIQARHMQPGSHLLMFAETLPPKIVVERAGLSPAIAMTRIKRIRLADGIPVGVHDSYLHNVVVSQRELEITESLYKVLEQQGIMLDEGEEMIEAVAADEEVAELLNIEPGFPLLRASRFSWDSSGQFVEYVVALYHADLYQYTIRLKR